VRLERFTVPALPRLHVDLLSELRLRGVATTDNNPTGDYAEWLFCSALGLSKLPNSSTSYDATDPEGRRFQINGTPSRLGFSSYLRTSPLAPERP
jgi:hypothetical protein